MRTGGVEGLDETVLAGELVREERGVGGKGRGLL